MKSKITLLFFTICLGFASNGFAQPANDDACNAIALPVDGTIGNYTNEEATVQALEEIPPATGCQTQDGWCVSSLTNSVWFTFIAPASGVITASTCLVGSYDTQIAVWQVSDCADFSTYTLVGANDDTPGGCANANFASFLNLTGLTVGSTYYVQVDPFSEFNISSFNIQLSDGYVVPPIPARIKIIHNSADAALSAVDIRIDGNFPDNDFFSYLDNMSFRTSTQFFNVAADSSISITVNSAGSVDDSAPLKTFDMSFTAGNHILILDGIYTTLGYTPSSVDKPLSLFEYNNAYEYGDFSDFDTSHVLIHHGATDAPDVDVVVIDPALGTIVDGINYSEFSNYFNLVDNTNYTLEVRTNIGDALVNTYVAPVQSDYWGGYGYTIVASGFLDPSLNSDGASFGLWAAPPYSGNLVPLQTLGNFEYDNVCDAAEVAVGSSIILSNTGLTVQVGEPSPAGGSCYTTSTWCENELSSTIWMKFVAPSTGDVTLTTCSDETTFNTQIAVYSGSCTDFSTFALVGANDDIDFNDPEYCFLGNYGASRLPLCNLIPDSTYYIQLDGSYGDFGTFNLSIEEGATCKARLKVIHNSADLAAAVVDVRVNGEFPDADNFFYYYFDDLEFRSSTDFQTVGAEVPLTITVNAADSEDDSAPLFTKIVTLAPNSTTILVAEGIISTGGYAPLTPFNLNTIANAKEGASDFTNTDLIFHHGSTDGYTIELNELSIPTPEIVPLLDYGSSVGYVTLPTADNYILQVKVNNFPINLDTVQAALASYNLGGEAITVCYSGFDDPSVNSGGAVVGMWFAESFGGPMQQFISPIENDAPCNAISLPTDGTVISGNNTGSTVDTLEVFAPSLDNENGFGYWGIDQPYKSVWYKFTATSVGAEVSTCHENTVLDTKIGIWGYADCGNYTTYTLKGAQDDAFDSCSVGAGTSAFSSIATICGLTIGDTYLVQVCSFGSFTEAGPFEISVDSIFCAVGLDEIKNVSNFKLYPNPANGNEVTIEFTNAKNNSTGIEILDATGKVINTYNYKNVAAGNFKQQLDVTNLTNGLYFVNIISDGKISSSKLQIIK